MRMRANEMALTAGYVRNAEVGSSSLLPSTTFPQKIRQFCGFLFGDRQDAFRRRGEPLMHNSSPSYTRHCGRFF